MRLETAAYTISCTAGGYGFYDAANYVRLGAKALCWLVRLSTMAGFIAVFGRLIATAFPAQPFIELGSL